MSAWAELERFLDTDPRDAGCEQALRMLHLYVELVCADASHAEARRRLPEVAAHLAACGPCADDFEGLLAAVRGETAD